MGAAERFALWKQCLAILNFSVKPKEDKKTS